MFSQLNYLYPLIKYIISLNWYLKYDLIYYSESEASSFLLDKINEHRTLIDSLASNKNYIPFNFAVITIYCLFDYAQQVIGVNL